MSLSLSVEPSDRALADLSVKALFGNAENERICGIKNEQRRRKSIAGLLALKNALRSDECREIFRDNGGRPRFSSGSGIDFSISHSASLSVAAVLGEAQGRVGVDIELVRKDRREENLRIAKRYFTESEAKIVSNGSSPEEFYRIWTEKEALAKLLGVGLAALISDRSVLSGCKGITVYRFELTYGAEKYLLTICSDVDSEVEIINGEEVSVCFIDQEIF